MSLQAVPLASLHANALTCAHSARGGRRDMALCFNLYFLSHSGRRPRHGVDRCALRPLLFSHPTCAQLMFALTATLTAPFAAHRLTPLKPHMLALLARARRHMFRYIFLRFSMVLEATTSNDDNLLNNLCSACAPVFLVRTSVLRAFVRVRDVCGSCRQRRPRSRA